MIHPPTAFSAEEQIGFPTALQHALFGAVIQRRAEVQTQLPDWTRLKLWIGGIGTTFNNQAGRRGNRILVIDAVPPNPLAALLAVIIRNKTRQELTARFLKRKLITAHILDPSLGCPPRAPASTVFGIITRTRFEFSVDVLKIHRARSQICTFKTLLKTKLISDGLWHFYPRIPKVLQWLTRTGLRAVEFHCRRHLIEVTVVKIELGSRRCRMRHAKPRTPLPLGRRANRASVLV